MREGWVETPLANFLKQSKKKVKLVPGLEYPAVGVMMEGRGFVTRPPFLGGKTTYKQLTPLEPSQLVLRSITAWEAPIQVTTEEHAGFHVSGVFPVFDIDESKIHPRFLSLQCRHEPFWESMRERTVGSVLRRKTLSARALMEIEIKLPPVAEQRRIVDLISSVDYYIKTLQQKLEIAKKSRNAVLSELLMAGGDGWVQKTLGEVAELQMGRTPSRREPTYWTQDLDFPFCTIADMDSKFVDPKREGVTKLAIQDGKAKVAKEGTLLMSFKLTIGRMGFASRDIYPNEAIVMINANESVVLNDFLFLALGFMDLTEGSGRAVKGSTLNSGSIAAIFLSIPPLAEQKRIIEILSSIDDMVNNVNRTLEKSKNLRSGLLSDLLSGEHEIPTSYDKFMDAA
jgi:type I restriction enzyme S subunit